VRKISDREQRQDMGSTKGHRQNERGRRGVAREKRAGKRDLRDKRGGGGGSLPKVETAEAR